MMVFKLLKGSLFRRISSTLLILGALWIGITLVVSLLTLVVTVGDKLNVELSSLGANIKVEPLETSLMHSLSPEEPLPSLAYLREEEVLKLKTQLFWRNNILGLCPRLWTGVRFKSRTLPLLGVWIYRRIPLEKNETFAAGALKFYKHWQVQGRWPEKGKGECMMGEKLAGQLGIFLGHLLKLKDGKGREKIWRVVGILTAQGREDRALVAELSDVQALAGLKGKVTSVDVSALTTPEKKIAIKHRQDPTSLTPEEYERWVCTPYPGTIAVQIQNTLPGTAALVIRRVSQTQGTLLKRIRGLIVALSSLTFFICCLSVMGVLTLTVMERSAEVALLHSLGATRGDVFFLFFLESSLLGFLAGLAAAVSGGCLGSWLMERVFATPLDKFPLGPVILAPFIGFLLANLATLWPLWQVFRKAPSRVLHEG